MEPWSWKCALHLARNRPLGLVANQESADVTLQCVDLRIGTEVAR